MVDAFEDRVEVYDAMINWPKRLAHEEPFYRNLCQQLSARRLLDVACGTGRHAAMFHSWGLEVQAADLSASMLQRARQINGTPDGLDWVQRGFDQPVPAPGAFDLAICIGNSLPLVDDPKMMQTAVAQMVRAVRPGGAVLVHILNLWRMPEAVPFWQKCIYVDIDGRRQLVIKGVHRCNHRGYVNLLITDPEQPALTSSCPSFTGVEAADLEQWMRSAGVARVQTFGGYRDQPYDRNASQDLIMIGYRAD